MHPEFQQLMHQATQLTRSGDLAAATAAIQAALRGGPPAVLRRQDDVDASDVITDVTAVDAAARIGRPVQAPPVAGRITRPVQGPAYAGRTTRPVQGPVSASRITRPVQGPVFA